MVPSSACISVATMAQTVISPRCGTTASARCGPAACCVDPDISAPEDVAQVPLVPGVDRDLGAHAGAELWPALGLLDPDADRDALHDLHPVARRVLRRQHAEG